MEIKLNDGQICLIDEEDCEFLSRFNWRAILQNGKYYVIAWIPMHRLLVDTEMHVDHINGNSLDNQKGNLRPATRSQNQQNAKLREDNTTGCKGVTISNGAYHVRISREGKRFNVGRFQNIIEAGEAYDLAALFLYGERANLNYPDKRSDYMQTLTDGYMPNWDR